jgi:tellurite resistance protein
MTKRLQVLLDETELEEIRQIAERERMTVAEWVRQTLRAARKERSRISPETKLEATRKAAEHAFPVSGIDGMLEEIERGYLHERPS